MRDPGRKEKGTSSIAINDPRSETQRSRRLFRRFLLLLREHAPEMEQHKGTVS